MPETKVLKTNRINMVEILGYVAMIIVLVSFTMKDMMKLRMLNSIACAMFVVYGIIHETTPIVIMNILVILVNVFYLIKERMEKKFYKESIFNSGKMKPLTGFEADVLNETLNKTSKSNPTLPGRK